MSKTRFCLYIFGPVALGYFLPMLLYKWPIKMYTFFGTHEITSKNVTLSMVACILWFGIVLFFISYPNLLPKKKTPVRYWTEKAHWIGFLCFSVFGAVISILHWIFVMPAAMEQVIHQLSLLPTLGLALGLYVLKDLEGKEKAQTKKLITLSLMGLSGFLVFAAPIVFGWVWPVVMGTVAILFAMSVMGMNSVKQVVALGIFTFIILIATVVKEPIRVLLCGGGGCNRIPIETVFQKKNFQLWKYDSESFDNGTLPSFKKIQRTLEIQQQVYSNTFDPNIKNIRFVPDRFKTNLGYFLVAKILYRINYFGQLGYVIQTTGEDIPYAYGETYYPLLSKFIPRVLWPDKPQEAGGQYFGHRYQILPEEDLATSVNMPLILESYVNWGWYGIIFSATLFGLVIRFLWEIWIGEHCATGNVILGMMVVFIMVGQESNLSGLLGGMLYGGIVFWLIEGFFRNWYHLKLMVGSTP